MPQVQSRRTDRLEGNTLFCWCFDGSDNGRKGGLAHSLRKMDNDGDLWRRRRRVQLVNNIKKTKKKKNPKLIFTSLPIDWWIADDDEWTNEWMNGSWPSTKEETMPRWEKQAFGKEKTAKKLGQIIINIIIIRMATIGIVGGVQLAHCVYRERTALHSQFTCGTFSPFSFPHTSPSHSIAILFTIIINNSNITIAITLIESWPKNFSCTKNQRPTNRKLVAEWEKIFLPAFSQGVCLDVFFLQKNQIGCGGAWASCCCLLASFESEGACKNWTREASEKENCYKSIKSIAQNGIDRFPPPSIHPVDWSINQLDEWG